MIRKSTKSSTGKTGKAENDVFGMLNDAKHHANAIENPDKNDAKAMLNDAVMYLYINI
ncbi:MULTISPECIES: hypothetical protein [unclassified Bartonella]|uniref:hypothetical protein n=1 Tax=unclassified Bartonella TaxID=2645622 RepID=UPI0035D00D74